MSDTIDRPDVVEDEHLSFLDELRQSGATNMFSAAPYIVREFGVPLQDARAIAVYWMKTFGERHPR